MNYSSLLQAARFTPKSMQFPNNWLGHSPFAAWLVGTIAPSIFVELGTHSGNSYFSFCQAVAEQGLATHCFAVDTWMGDPHAGGYPEEIYAKVAQHNEEEYGEFSQLLRMTFDEAVVSFADNSIGLLHIDGMHTYEAVRHDFETWLPKLSKDAVVLFHDIAVKENDFGVHIFWEELKRKFKYHLEFDHANGLGVLCISDNLVGKNGFSFFANESGKVELEHYFSCLGNNVDLAYDLLSERNNILSLQKKLDHNAWIFSEEKKIYRKEINKLEGEIHKINNEFRNIENKYFISKLESIKIIRQRSSQDYKVFLPFLPLHKGAVSWGNNLPFCYKDNSSFFRKIEKKCRLFLPHSRKELSKFKNLAAKTALFDPHYYASQDEELSKGGKDLLAHYFFTGAWEGRNPTPYFFTDWYLAEYPDVAAMGINPLYHFLLYGAAEGRNPNPYFLTKWYLEAYPQVKELGMNPLQYYLQHGKEEGTWPNPYFDPTWYENAYPEAAGLEPFAHFLGHGAEYYFQPNPYFDGRWYLQHYPRVGKMGLHPLQHYIQYGLKEQTEPNPYFDTLWYLEQYPEAKSDSLCPLAHYLKHVHSGTVNPNAYFDAKWYMNTYPDIRKNNLDPLLHFIIIGAEERRDPGPFFSTEWYLFHNEDVATNEVNPLLHYLHNGAYEMRDPAPAFDTSWYVHKYPEVLKSGMPPLMHYICLGYEEGKLPFDPKETTIRKNNYASWFHSFYAIGELDKNTMKCDMVGFAYCPLISVVMPVYNPPPHLLAECIDSVCGQVYENWELCIADDASTDPQIRPLLQRYAEKDSRIKVVFREENGHISRASNSAIELAQGEFIALLDHDDLLTPDALFWVVESLQRHPDAGIFYSDEDRIDEEGVCQTQYFKSDWNPYLFWCQNMASHLGVYRTALIREVQGFRVGFEGSQDYDLAARIIGKLNPSQIVHIPRILYHWRVIPGSTATSMSEKPYAQAAAEKTVNELLQRQKIPAKMLANSMVGDIHQQVEFFPLANPPLVSIIIPTRNRLDLVKTCIESIIIKTIYTRYEIILVDNGSDEPESLAYFAELDEQGKVRLVRDDGPFNYSRLNNMAVGLAAGEIIVLLNNDTEVISENWLEEMVQLALLPDVGAVGAKLLYSNDTIQHAGVVLGFGGGASHIYLGAKKSRFGYLGQLHMLREYSAVTGACLAVRKALYEEVGGLDEELLPIGYNDVDFCLKLRQRGLRNLWTPLALLYHHESLSRGVDNTPEKERRFWNELSRLKKRWPHAWASDPAYNPNLTLTNTDCSLAHHPRAVLPARHWPEPFISSFVAPVASLPRLLLVVSDDHSNCPRILTYARALLEAGKIDSYGVASSSSFTEVSAKASGWFDVIWLQGTLSRLGWFERLLMKYYPYLVDINDESVYLEAPEVGVENKIYQSLVHAAAFTTPEMGIAQRVEQLYSLDMTRYTRIVPSISAGQKIDEDILNTIMASLEQVKMEAPLPACRIQFH